jgi:hypothetical protein
LAWYARRRGYTTFIAPMSRGNSRALLALWHCGLPYTLEPLDDQTLLAAVNITPMQGFDRAHGA